MYYRKLPKNGTLLHQVTLSRAKERSDWEKLLHGFLRKAHIARRSVGRASAVPVTIAMHCFEQPAHTISAKRRCDGALHANTYSGLAGGLIRTPTLQSFPFIVTRLGYFPCGNLIVFGFNRTIVVFSIVTAYSEVLIMFPSGQIPRLLRTCIF